MRVDTFPQCCGAGVLVIECLTGKGEAADLEEIKKWVYYARRNGYRMYDFPGDYGGQPGDPRSSKSVLGGKGDRPGWNTHNSWGMLLAMTNPNQVEAGQRLAKFGFKELLTTRNPVYSDRHHKITLWGLDMNEYTEAMLRPAPTNPFATMTGTLGCLASGKTPPTRDAQGRFASIAKAPAGV